MRSKLLAAQKEIKAARASEKLALGAITAAFRNPFIICNLTSRRCLELARKAIGCTSPNPMVGCVIVKDGKIIGERFHPKAGQPHAEVLIPRFSFPQPPNVRGQIPTPV
ncbi:hypothetical protein LXL04_008914 [Taraxacum kok-saghyz]